MKDYMEMNLRDQSLDVKCTVETKETGSRLNLIAESTDALLSHSSSDLLYFCLPSEGHVANHVGMS